MRRLLFHMSYTAVLLLEARGGVEPRAFPPSSRRFGLEDRRRERGPDRGGDGEIRTHTLLFTGQLLCQLELHRRSYLRSGREADHASSNSALPDSHRSAGMSHAPITCDLNLVPKEGLKPSTSGL